MISKAAYPQALLNSDRDKTATPATDICYKSLAISSVKNEQLRKREMEDSDKKDNTFLEFL